MSFVSKQEFIHDKVKHYTKLSNKTWVVHNHEPYVNVLEAVVHL